MPRVAIRADSTAQVPVRVVITARPSTAHEVLWVNATVANVFHRVVRVGTTASREDQVVARVLGVGMFLSAAQVVDRRGPAVVASAVQLVT